MTNWYKIFYWLTVADGVKSFLDVFSNVLMFLTLFVAIAYFISTLLFLSNDGFSESEKESIAKAKKYTTRTFRILGVLTTITWLAWVMTPTKKDCLLIIAGGAVGNFISTDSSAKQLPSDLTRFLHLSLKKEVESLGEESRQELGLSSKKDKLVHKIKNLEISDSDKEDLIEYIVQDSTLIK